MATTHPSLNERMRNLPSVEAVLTHPLMQDCTSTLTHALCTNAARQAIQAARETLKSDEAAVISHEDIARDAAHRAHLLAQPSLRRVVNATGVVIHTN